MDKFIDVLELAIVKNAQWVGFFILTFVSLGIIGKILKSVLNSVITQQEKLADHIDRQSKNIEALTKSTNEVVGSIQILFNTVQNNISFNERQYDELKQTTDKLEEDHKKIMDKISTVENKVNLVERNTISCIQRGE